MFNRALQSARRSLVLIVCIVAIGTPALHGAAMGNADQPAVAVAPPADAPRPAALAPLYVSFAALQVLDIHSTLRAPATGAREMNPVVSGLLGSPAALVAAKAGVAAGMIFVSEGVRKHHPRTALLTMFALNSAYAIIVAHNYVSEARVGRSR
jgi:uncharacterized protein DUF5658